MIVNDQLPVVAALTGDDGDADGDRNDNCYGRQRGRAQQDDAHRYRSSFREATAMTTTATMSVTTTSAPPPSSATVNQMGVADMRLLSWTARAGDHDGRYNAHDQEE
jgi:hypothetical protein